MIDGAASIVTAGWFLTDFSAPGSRRSSGGCPPGRRPRPAPSAARCTSVGGEHWNTHLGDSENAARPSGREVCSGFTRAFSRQNCSARLTLFVVMTNSNHVSRGSSEPTQACAEGSAFTNLGLSQRVRRCRFPSDRGKKNLEVGEGEIERGPGASADLIPAHLAFADIHLLSATPRTIRYCRGRCVQLTLQLTLA